MKYIIFFLIVTNIVCEQTYNINCLEEEYEHCVNSKANNIDPIVIIMGAGLGLIFAPIIAPFFAGAGLYGAAATSHGLATMGFGSLASGGAGMFGGQIVSTVSGAITGSLLSITVGNNIDYQCMDHAKYYCEL